MNGPRTYWTVGTRDLRNLISFEFASRDGAARYRDTERLDGWIVVNVEVSQMGRSYTSPELPDGPELVPAAGNF